MPVVQTSVMPVEGQPVQTKAGWGTILGSMLLALGFASAFVGPIFPRATPSETVDTIGGEVLGDAVSRPLEVTVSVQVDGSNQVYTVQPQSGTVTEALAKAAKLGRTGFVYATRGSSIYVDTFFAKGSHGDGQWIILVNGNMVTDLSTVELSQGDQIIARWVPAGA